jgi:hypothetical protein
MSGHGPKPKSNFPVIMSAMGGKADVPQTSSIGSYSPKAVIAHARYAAIPERVAVFDKVR